MCQFNYLSFQRLYNQKMDQFQQKRTHSTQISHNQDSQIIEQRSSKSSGAGIVRRYKKGQFLGKGGFARCYEIQNVETNKISAIKIVCKQTLKKAKAKQKLITQIKIHKTLSHKNVVTFDHVFEDNSNVYIVLELCSNHTLNEMIRKRKQLTQFQVQYLLYQIIQGMQYIHSNKVIHRDLKLGNLMLNEQMQIKIGDFGLAAKLQYNTQKRKTICGTPNYLAPQIIDGKGHSYEVDIWSIGVIMYALLFGRPPFQTNDVKKTYKKIKQCQYTFNEEMNVSHNAKNLISRILVLDPSKRLTLDQILVHPFMNSNKIPKSIPNCALTTALPKSFVQQYAYYGGGLNSSKFQNSMKILQKVEGQYQKAKLQKGISQRLLLRSSTGLNRNFFVKNNNQKQQSQSFKPALSNNFFTKPQTPKSKQRMSLSKVNSVYVKKWVDYSSKYGLGYLLSDGTTGIYFNDSTKMSLDQLAQKIDYITNQTIEGKILVSFNLSQGSNDRQINKKITLMQYFRKYLNGNMANDQNDQNKQNTPPFYYIKKWTKSDQAILFRLNNKVIQTNFNDKSQIMIYGQSGMVAYCGVNNSQRLFYSIDSAEIRKHSQFNSKLQHVKLLLKKMNKPRQETGQIINQFGREMIKGF